MTFDPNQPHDLADLPPIKKIETEEILKLTNVANRELAALKGYCMSLPNPRLLMSAAIAKESAESSQIENINTTVRGVLTGQVLPKEEMRPEDKEGINYRQAMDWGFLNLEKFSLSSRLIKGIHNQLITNSTGYRQQQNSIYDSISKTVIYTPPIASNINRYLKNWEDFSNQVMKSNLDPLIRCVISHYQFEAIHPFMDGNGRTGRILFALQLVTEKLLIYPVLFISGYINSHKSQYYKTLLNVTKYGDWSSFVKFVLTGVEVQSRKTTHKLFQMMATKTKLENTLKNNHSKMNAIETADHLFAFPVTTPTDFAKALGIHYQTASKHLKELKEAGLLYDSIHGKRHLYSLKTVLDMISSND